MIDLTYSMMIPCVGHARHEVSGTKDSGIWDCATRFYKTLSSKLTNGDYRAMTDM